MRAAEILNDLAQPVAVTVVVILAAVSTAAMRRVLTEVTLAAPVALYPSGQRGWTHRWNARRGRKDGMDRIHDRCSASADLRSVLVGRLVTVILLSGGRRSQPAVLDKCAEFG